MTETKVAPKKKFNPRSNQAKGSKYAKKGNGQKKPTPQIKRGEPVFSYFVEGTNVKATKVPCERNPEATKDKPSMSSLGSWRNPVTGKPCKVVRVKNKPEVVDESHQP